jgi:leader peptidase (prepilin peptidase)/N-methyltransferase
VSLFAQQLADSALPAPVWWLLAVWMFALGASIGSFMNVVVYRLPAGLSLVHPGSHCPKCKTPLAARDNIPIFGWLWLRGRCRYCGAPISARYPTIELLTACMFALLACAEPLAGGANLPPGHRLAESELPALWILWTLFAYHSFLLCGLVCAALMEYDGQPIGPRLWLPMFAVGAAAPLFFPELRPVASGLLSSDALAAAPWAAGIVDGLVGAAAGVVAGLATWPENSAKQSRDTARPFRSTRNISLALASAGLFLGWQAIGPLALAMATLKLALNGAVRIWPSVARSGWIGCLAPLTLAWIVAWRPLAASLAFSRPATEVGAFGAAMFVTASFAWAIGRLTR